MINSVQSKDQVQYYSEFQKGFSKLYISQNKKCYVITLFKVEKSNSINVRNRSKDS